MTVIRLISAEDKDMANGMRDTSGIPLSESEIQYVKSEIQRIEADPSVFVFNDEGHLSLSTCYNFYMDKIYVTRNVFPDEKYGSIHPRDLMSVGAVLAHEYYGHRPYRDEYLSDAGRGKDYHTTPIWQDECRAGINAAKTAPNLTERDKSNLVMDAVYRAKEFGHLTEMDDFMKVLYGYSSNERNVSYRITQSVMFANQAMLEYQKTGHDTIKCPKCHEHPRIMITSRGERTIISCPCGYILNIEINF